MAKIGTIDSGLHGDMWDAIRAARKKVEDERKAGEQGLSGSTLSQYQNETQELMKLAEARVRKEYQVKLNAVIDSNPGNLYGGGTVIGPSGIDNILANLTAGEEVITNKDNIASNFRTHLKEINDNGGKLWTAVSAFHIITTVFYLYVLSSCEVIPSDRQDETQRNAMNEPDPYIKKCCQPKTTVSDGIGRVFDSMKINYE